MSSDYRQELRALHVKDGMTWYEIEHELGLSHATQGKTLRRYLQGTRAPSQEVQKRIHKLYLDTLKATLYFQPILVDDASWGRQAWEETKVRLGDYPVSALERVLKATYERVKRESLSPAAEYRIQFGHGKAKDIGNWYVLESRRASERWLLLYLIHSLPDMKVLNWRIMVDETLRTLRRIKPGLYRVMYEATKGLG